MLIFLRFPKFHFLVVKMPVLQINAPPRFPTPPGSPGVVNILNIYISNRGEKT
jgi:hypothetical protein